MPFESFVKGLYFWQLLSAILVFFFLILYFRKQHYKKENIKLKKKLEDKKMEKFFLLVFIRVVGKNGTLKKIEAWDHRLNQIDDFKPVLLDGDLKSLVFESSS